MPPKHRLTSESKKRYRNLTQYRDMTDEEFDAMWEVKVTGIETVKEFENRIQRKIDEFAEDYDLGDLKANDKLTLRALAQAYITLEDLESYSFNQRVEGIEEDSILAMDKISNMMSRLRSDISNMQNDLKITRKVRKGDKEESVINYIEDLKLKAKKFYEQKMMYIFCPKCGMLLATMWFLYPDYKTNYIDMTCHRPMPDGKICGERFTISTKDLLNNRGSNRPDLMPEGMQ